MDPVVRLARGLLDLTSRTVTRESAVVTSTSPLAVQGSDGDVQLSALGWYRPRVGDTVDVLRAGSWARILGPTVPNPSTRPPANGIVTAVTGATVTVTASGFSYPALPYPAAYSPVSGDSVLMVWQEYAPDQWSGIVIGKSTAPVTPVSATPAAQPVPPPVVPPSVQDIDNPYLVTAYDAATWRNGWRTDTTTLYSGDWTGRGNNHAYLFYGGRFGALRGKTVTSARVRLYALAGGGFGATPNPMRTHNASNRPSAEPVTANAFAGPSLADNANGWATVPTATAQALVDGTEQGLVVYGTGTSEYTALTSLSAQPLQGAVEITWA